jgi:hypothetical protein
MFNQLGNKRSFGDLEDDEDDIFSSKKVPSLFHTHTHILVSATNYEVELFFFSVGRRSC